MPRTLTALRSWNFMRHGVDIARTWSDITTMHPLKSVFIRIGRTRMFMRTDFFTLEIRLWTPPQAPVYREAANMMHEIGTRFALFIRHPRPMRPVEWTRCLCSELLEFLCQGKPMYFAILLFRFALSSRFCEIQRCQRIQRTAKSKCLNLAHTKRSVSLFS